MKVLFVGLGGIGQRHLRNLKMIVGDTLEVLAYRERNSGQVINDKLDIEEGVDLNTEFDIKVFQTMDEAFAQNPAIVYICNPTSMHLKVARVAAEYGCHFFVEKALSDSIEGVSELIDLARTKNLICMVGYQMRFHPCIKVMEEILKSGSLGKVIAVNAEVGEYMPAWHKYEDYRQLYAARRELGGGVIVSQIHEFDYIQWLFGYPRKIYAVGGHLSSLEIDVEDIALITMECIQEDGTVIPVHLHQDFLQRPSTRTCKVVGDKGTLVLDFFSIKVTQYGECGEIVREAHFPDFERNQMFLEQTRHFLKCVETSSQPCVTLAGGAQSLQMALAAKKSIETGEVIYL